MMYFYKDNISAFCSLDYSYEIKKRIKKIEIKATKKYHDNEINDYYKKLFSVFDNYNHYWQIYKELNHCCNYDILYDYAYTIWNDFKINRIPDSKENNIIKCKEKARKIKDNLRNVTNIKNMSLADVVNLITDYTRCILYMYSIEYLNDNENISKIKINLMSPYCNMLSIPVGDINKKYTKKYKRNNYHHSDNSLDLCDPFGTRENDILKVIGGIITIAQDINTFIENSLIDDSFLYEDQKHAFDTKPENVQKGILPLYINLTTLIAFSLIISDEDGEFDEN